MTSIKYALLYKRIFYVRPIFAKFNPRFTFIHTSQLRYGDRPIEIKMPALSPTMTEGTIVKWLKKEGDIVSPGDVLCEIQTDKAVVALETEEEGILAKILIPEDTQNVQLGKIIAIITEDGSISNETLESVHDVSDKKPVPQFREEEKRGVKDAHILVGPAARKLLQEYGIKSSDIAATGPHNTPLKSDVIDHIKEKNIKQAVPPKKSKDSSVSKAKVVDKGKFSDIQITDKRRSIAEQMVQAKFLSPHEYMSVDCNIDRVFACIELFKKQNSSVTLLDFIIKSAAIALSKVSALNITCVAGQVKASQTVDVSISLPSNEGSVTHFMKNVADLTIPLISNFLKTSSQSPNACVQPLVTPLSIYFLGESGVPESSAIIMAPNVAVLTVGRIKTEFQGNAEANKLTATFSFNSAVVNEVDAARFMQCFKRCIDEPFAIIGLA